MDDDFGNRVDYKSKAKPQYRDPEASFNIHRQGNGQGGRGGKSGFGGGNPNRGTPAALEESHRPAVTLTGRKAGDIKPAALFSPRNGNGNR